MRIAIVSDAWHPQVNGVVRTLHTTASHLRTFGHSVEMVTPQDFRTLPCPTYPEIRLALAPSRQLSRRLDAFAPEAVHIATEGPLGHAAHRWCRRRNQRFTTSFHTQLPEYLRLRAPVPITWTYAYLKRFHGAAVSTLVPTPSQRQRLADRGFRNLLIWSRGVNTEVFNAADRFEYDLPRPIHIYMGRVAVEKNIEAFLSLRLAGSKVVIGDGPDLDKLRSRYTDAYFVGAKFDRELAAHLAGGDVFVFPSRTDTFGLVMLEAMACGLPVAAYPVQGPIDVIAHERSGVLHQNLESAIAGALSLNRTDCIAHARKFSWAETTRGFEGALVPN